MSTRHHLSYPVRYDELLPGDRIQIALRGHHVERDVLVRQIVEEPDGSVTMDISRWNLPYRVTVSAEKVADGVSLLAAR